MDAVPPSVEPDLQSEADEGLENATQEQISDLCNELVNRSSVIETEGTSQNAEVQKKRENKRPYCVTAESCATTTDSQDFTSIKRSKPTVDLSQSVDQEGDLCSICFCAWTTDGSHRIIALKCGHLYGKRCIEKWMLQKSECPQCKRRIRKSEFRPIFARCIKAVDNTELQKALDDLAEERKRRMELHLDLVETKFQYHLVSVENEKLRQENEFLKKQQRLQSTLTRNTSNASLNLNFSLEYASKLSGGGRVIVYHPYRNLLLHTQFSNTVLFPGYGLRKVNAAALSLSDFVLLHQGVIRDIAVNYADNGDLIVTAGLDNKVRLVDIHSNSVVHSYHVECAAWSCAWNLDHASYFYVGLSNGRVLVFDQRITDRPVEILNSSRPSSPVVSLQYIPASTKYKFREGGLFVAQLLKGSFFKFTNGNEHQYNPLPLNGKIMSLHFELLTGHLLASFRPCNKYNFVRHEVYEASTGFFLDGKDFCALDLLTSLEGSSSATLLSRSKLCMINDALYACVFDEKSSEVRLWDISSNSIAHKFTNLERIIDLCPYTYNDNIYISTLSDTALNIFKYDCDI